MKIRCIFYEDFNLHTTLDIIFRLSVVAQGLKYMDQRKFGCSIHVFFVLRLFDFSFSLIRSIADRSFPCLSECSVHVLVCSMQEQRGKVKVAETSLVTGDQYQPHPQPLAILKYEALYLYLPKNLSPLSCHESRCITALQESAAVCRSAS